ncbi:hypothetical protein HCH54_008821 [Aspergillus fumigatus]
MPGTDDVILFVLCDPIHTYCERHGIIDRTRLLRSMITVSVPPSRLYNGENGARNDASLIDLSFYPRAQRSAVFSIAYHRGKSIPILNVDTMRRISSPPSDFQLEDY